jgi:hypothetical protein
VSPEAQSPAYTYAVEETLSGLYESQIDNPFDVDEFYYDTESETDDEDLDQPFVRETSRARQRAVFQAEGVEVRAGPSVQIEFETLDGVMRRGFYGRWL